MKCLTEEQPILCRKKDSHEGSNWGRFVQYSYRFFIFESHPITQPHCDHYINFVVAFCFSQRFPHNRTALIFSLTIKRKTDCCLTRFLLLHRTKRVLSGSAPTMGFNVLMVFVSWISGITRQTRAVFLATLCRYYTPIKKEDCG